MHFYQASIMVWLLYILQKVVWEVRFYIPNILKQTENIQIFPAISIYLVSEFEEWEVQVRDCNLLCLGILKDKNSYGVKYHLQIALSKIYMYLPKPIQSLHLDSKDSDSKRYFYTHSNTRLANWFNLHAKSDWLVMTTKGMGIGCDGTYDL